MVVGGQVGYMPINFQPWPAHSYGARPCQSLHKPHLLVVVRIKATKQSQSCSAEKELSSGFFKVRFAPAGLEKIGKNQGLSLGDLAKYVKTRSLHFVDFLQTGSSESNFEKSSR